MVVVAAAQQQQQLVDSLHDGIGGYSPIERLNES